MTFSAYYSMILRIISLTITITIFDLVMPDVIFQIVKQPTKNINTLYVN